MEGTSSGCPSTPAKAGLLIVAAALILDCVALTLDVIRSARIVRGASVAESGLEISSTLSKAANLAVPAAIVIAAPLFLWWFHCSYRQLAERSAARYNTNWALAGWVVPGLNIIRPPAIMNELSGHREAVLWWWVTWAVGFFVQGVLRFVTPTEQSGWLLWQATALAADVVLLVSLVLAVNLVDRVVPSRT